MSNRNWKIIGADGVRRPADLLRAPHKDVDGCQKLPHDRVALSGHALAQIALSILAVQRKLLNTLGGRGTDCAMSQSKAALSLAPADTSTPDIEATLQSWEPELRVRLGHSDLHVRKSIKAVRDYFAWCGGKPSASILNRPSLVRWATSIVDPNNPGSRTTAQNKVSQLRGFCEWCVSEGVLSSNPIEKLKTPGARGRKAGAVNFTVPQVRALIEAAEKREAATNKDGSPDMRVAKNGPLSSTFYEFITITGLRYGESGTQLWEDINLEEAWIVLTKDKAGRCDKIPLTRAAVETLTRWREYSRGELLFPKKPSHNTLLLDMQACNIDGWQRGPDKKVSGQWHRFRKTATTERARGGADIRNLHKFSRHRDINETLNVYDFAAVDELRSTAELMPSLRGGKSKAQTGGKVKPVQKISQKALDKTGGNRQCIGVTVGASELPRNLPHPEPHVDARARGTGSDCDKQNQSFARVSTQGFGRTSTTTSEQSVMEPGGISLPSRPCSPEELEIIRMALALAHESVRRLGGSTDCSPLEQNHGRASAG